MKRIYSSIRVLLPIFLFTVCRKDEMVTNRPPLANAGKDIFLMPPTDSTILDGSASTDPENNIASYTWTKISGPASINIANPNGVRTAITKMTAGVYQFELSVTDRGGLSAKDTVRVNVFNQPPIAHAGNDTTILLPVNSTILDASASTDPENNIVSYIWQELSGPAGFTLSSTGFEKRLLSNLGEGVYVFELTVTDAGGLFSKDTVRISVSKTNYGGQEIVFSNLLWELSDFYGLGMDDIYVGTPAKPEIFINSYTAHYGLQLPQNGEVYIKFDTANSWIPVVSAALYNPNLPYQYVYDVIAPYLFVHIYPLNYQLVGSRVSIKIKFP